MTKLLFPGQEDSNRAWQKKPEFSRKGAGQDGGKLAFVTARRMLSGT
jgi:hypothetical protein